MKRQKRNRREGLMESESDPNKQMQIAIYGEVLSDKEVEAIGLILAAVRDPKLRRRACELIAASTPEDAGSPRERALALKIFYQDRDARLGEDEEGKILEANEAAIGLGTDQRTAQRLLKALKVPTAPGRPGPKPKGN